METKFKMDIKIDTANNFVTATLYEDCGEQILKPITSSTGLICKDGVLGITQAASYACKRIYENFGGSYKKGVSRNDK